MKLVHCIHLQQLELTQRAAAANERASEIAKVAYNIGGNYNIIRNLPVL